MKDKPQYIAFEGMDGAGKTTQAKLFQSFLASINIKSLMTKEPGGTPAGIKIKEILLENKIYKETELLLFLADRSQHIREVVKPNIEKGVIVVSDRSLYSTIAYQGFGKGIDVEFLHKLSSFTNNSILPQVVFLIDTQPEVCAMRCKERDKEKSESISFLKKVREGYLKLSEKKAFKKAFFVMDGQKDIATLHEDILKVWNKL
ncbi:MAG: dTMP kinase [Campylobacterota bacterium]|nr:dTMP kinase [Campylobacterota bacterium]